MKIKFLTVLSIAIALFIGACGKSDADLTKAVQDKLAADKVTGVTVAVKGGVATLTGEVADITVKNKAATSAKAVEDVPAWRQKVEVRMPAIVPRRVERLQTFSFR